MLWSQVLFIIICVRIWPVDTPQLRRQALLGGMRFGWSLMRWATSTTVYSEKLETNMKWCKMSPLRSVNLVVPHRGIPRDRLKGSLEQRLLFSDMQSLHSPHSATNVGITISPCFTSFTSSPTLSTSLQHHQSNPFSSNKIADSRFEALIFKRSCQQECS